jgi:hypothetical protein
MVVPLDKAIPPSLVIPVEYVKLGVTVPLYPLVEVLAIK